MYACTSLRVEACPLCIPGVNSLDFVVRRFFMKLFKTRKIVNYGRTQFSFELRNNLVSLRSRIFEAKYRMFDYVFCKFIFV